MMSCLRLLYMLAMALTFTAAALTTPAQAARLSQAQVLLDGEQTSVILDFDGPYQTPVLFALDSPRRIVVDLPGVDASVGPAGASGGLVSTTRIGRPAPGSSRMVIDLARPVTVIDTRSSDPISGPGGYRLTIRLGPGSEADFAKLLGRGRIKGPQMASAATPPPAQLPVPTVKIDPKPIQVPGVPPPAATLPTEPVMSNEPMKPQPITVPMPRPPAANPIRGRIPVVVIDPGHGGHDPGAPSALKGRYEKEVALAIALAVKNELQKTGKFKVVLTRETDVFIPFRERLDVARRANADMFMSIHADSIADKSVRGSTIYTLSDGRADKEAERLAAAENKADFVGGGINIGGERDDVVDILFSLVQRETRNYSAEIAEYVARELSRYVLMRPRYHRSASLIVLTLPDIPSVLIETGYMTSEADSQMLFSKEGQANIARAIRQATETYFDRRTGK
jgi:N-acetylmuramoyl-L-alanine amidase